MSVRSDMLLGVRISFRRRLNMNNRNASLVPLVIGTALSLVACGEDEKGSEGADGGVSDAVIASFEGVYALTAYTENPTSCDAEGPSTLASKTDQDFVLVGASVLGQKYLQLASCEPAACADTVSAIRDAGFFSPEYSLILSEEVGPDALSGFLAMSGFLTDGSCTEREYETHALTRMGDVVHVESRLIPLADEPPEDGVCWARPEQQREEAEGRPCAALETISGKWILPLP